MKEKSSMKARQVKKELYKYVLDYVNSNVTDVDDAIDVIGSLSEMLKNVTELLLLAPVLGRSTNEVFEGFSKSLKRYEKREEIKDEK